MVLSLRLWVCVVFCGALDLASASSVLVGFRTVTDGGLVRVLIDDAGAVKSPAAVLMRAPSFRHGGKLRVSADGQDAVLDAAVEGAPNLALINLDEGQLMPPRLITLDFEPDELRLWRDRIFVGGGDGWIVSIERKTGRVLHRWNAREQLNPPGHKAEDLFVLEPEGVLFATLQKDGKKGRQGSRLISLKLEDLTPVADLTLPRDHPELHLSAKEAGPSPEIIQIDRASNTVLLTFDLYGALAFADLSAATAARGAWKNALVLPTSADGAWGTAFPDRVALVTHDGRSFAFVSNASVDGGIAIFDVAARKRAGFVPVEAGCDYPVVREGGRLLATVISGKVKHRESGGISKNETPGSDLLLIDVAGAIRGERAALKRIPLGAPATRIVAVAGSENLVAVSLAGDAPQLVIYDTTARKETSRTPIPGEVTGLASAP